MNSNIIRFDWAIKRLLRNKANFVVLEGFLSVLLKDNIRIVKILESEGNKTDESDKFNRVDILAENSKQDLVIIEVQNTRELYYFQRMLYGVSKAITEYICEGDQYSEIRKLYSVNIVYFDLGQGKDYIYHGFTDFTGIHAGDTLLLSQKQRNTFMRERAGDVFPEYFILRVNEFNEKAITPIDEWIAYLKTGKIPESVKAPGLAEARQLLQVDQMTPADKANYYRHIENLRVQWDVIYTAREEGLDEGRDVGRAEGRADGKADGKAEGLKEKSLEIARKAKAKGMSDEDISGLTDLTAGEIENL